MKKEDLKKGVIYQFTWGTDSRISIGTVYDDGSDFLDNYIFKEFEYHHHSTKGNSSMNNAIKNCSLANSNQIKWFNACKKAEKFISPDKIKISNNYPIY
jgi:hypothetical protein